MKKLLNILFILVFVCSLGITAALPAAAEEVEPPKGTAWEDWDIEDGYVYGYYGDATELTIPAIDQNGTPITTIFDNAFMDNTTLKKVVVSEGIEMLGGQCFRGCTALETCVLPQSVNSFTWGVNFAECTSLTTINLPAALEEIPVATFSGCTSMSEIVITYGVKRILVNSFNGTKLTRVVLPETVEAVSSQAFSNLETESSFELIICNPDCGVGGAFTSDGRPSNILGARNEIECRVIGHENSTTAAFCAQDGLLPKIEFVAKPAEYFEKLPENQVGYGVDIGGNFIEDILPWIIIGAVAVVVLTVGAVVIVIVVKKTSAKKDEDEQDIDLEAE